MGFISDVGRVGLGVMTGGLSEVARAGYNAAKPKDINTPAALRNGATDLGASSTKPNPAFAAWRQQGIALQTALAAAKNPMLGGTPEKVAALEQKLQAHNAARPPEVINTELGQRVENVDAASAAATQGIGAASQALQQTGAQAQAQGQQVNAQAQQQAAASAGRAAPQMTETAQSQAAQ
jgi:hypothetical protein